MEIIEVGFKEYNDIIQNPYHIFGSSSFTNINKNKVEEVFYLLFKDTKYRAGISGGLKNNSFLSPFSAPFGGLMYVNNDIKITQIEECIKSFVLWLNRKDISSCRITLPPSIYNESFISKQANVLFRSGFDIKNIDLNYSFNTLYFGENYKSIIWRNSKKNLNIALSNNLSFNKCETYEDKKIAYEIIFENRRAKGFPLRMSWEQVFETTSIIPADFFICKNDNIAIASAIVFYVTTDIVQVIYWGDLLDYSHYKTMNFVSYKVFEYYMNNRIKIIDIGPSTENSVPNYGLCEFKESVGCDINQKLTFSKNL